MRMVGGGVVAGINGPLFRSRRVTSIRCFKISDVARVSAHRPPVKRARGPGMWAVVCLSACAMLCCQCPLALARTPLPVLTSLPGFPSIGSRPRLSHHPTHPIGQPSGNAALRRALLSAEQPQQRPVLCILQLSVPGFPRFPGR